MIGASLSPSVAAASASAPEPTAEGSTSISSPKSSLPPNTYLSPVRIDSIIRKKSVTICEEKECVNPTQSSSSLHLKHTPVTSLSTSASPSIPIPLTTSPYITPTKMGDNTSPLSQRRSSRAAVEGIYNYLNTMYADALPLVQALDLSDAPSASKDEVENDISMDSGIISDDIGDAASAESARLNETVQSKESKKFAKVRSKIRKERQAAKEAQLAEEEEKRRNEGGILKDVYIPLVNPVRDVNNVVSGLNWVIGYVMEL